MRYLISFKTAEKLKFLSSLFSYVSGSILDRLVSPSPMDKVLGSTTALNLLIVMIGQD